MIKYALRCSLEHEFEAWFANSSAYDEQSAAGLVECPLCGDAAVRKQIMAPALALKTRAAPPGAPPREVAAEAAGERPADATAGDGEAAAAPQAPEAAARRAAFAALAERVRAHVADTHEYVGDRFPQEARAMHDGAKDARPIYGEATPEEARALREEGAPVAPLPPAFAPTPPKKVN